MSDTGFDYENMTPEEQQMLQFLLGQMQQGRIAPGAYGGDYGPTMDQPGLDLAGYFPTNLPQLTTKNKVDPFDLSQQQQRWNLGQDVINTYDDPMLAALGGPGAFGPEAFTPTYDYGEPLNMKDRKNDNALINSGR